MVLTSSERESIKKLQRQREQEIKNLNLEIKQHLVAKEAAFNKYKEAKADEKRLEKEINLLKKKIEKDLNAADGSKKQYRKPSKGEINLVVEYINQRLITRSEGAESLGIPYSSMCRYVLNNGVKGRNSSYKLPNLKILEEHVAKLMKYIEKVPDATQSMIKKFIVSNCDIFLSTSSILYILKSKKIILNF